MALPCSKLDVESVVGTRPVRVEEPQDLSGFVAVQPPLFRSDYGILCTLLRNVQVPMAC